jgi:hypothetical protein
MNLKTDVSAARFPTLLTLTNGVTIELVIEESMLCGLGAVFVQGVPLRAKASPIRPDFSTPDGLHYQDFILRGIDETPDGVVLRTGAIGRQEVYGEMMDEYSYNLAFPKLRSRQTDQFDWLIRPCELELDGQKFAGFSLAFKFHSDTAQIHRLTTVSTWEIGGEADGNTIYHQAYSCRPVFEVKRDNHFSTSCLKRLDLWNHWLGHSFQMLPRWGCIQPFDFQAAAQGVLLGYWDEPHAVKSLVQKNLDENVIFVVDEYDFPLTNSITTPAKHVVFSPSPAERPRLNHEVINLWTRAFDHTGELIRGFFGLKNCEPLPIGGLPYKGRHSIRRSELAAGRQPDWMWEAKDGKFYFLLEGERIESRDLLYWTADKILPKLHAQGLKRIMFEPIHESDFTELCFAYHAETGWHDDMVCTSVCGSHRYVPAAFYDGWKGWNYLAAKAKTYDISLGHWVGLHLAPRAKIVQEHPEYLIQHVNTLAHGGGYSHQFIGSINWCSGAKQWFLDDMRRWRDEGGLEWLFFDSWPNLGCTPLNYAGRMEPMQYELGDVLAQLQQMGYNWFSFEGTSPFGVHQYGLWDPMEDYEKHVSQGVAGQNDFGTWIGHEYMGYNQTLGPNLNVRRDKSTIPDMSFRYMANRSLTLVTDGEMILTYQTLQPLMRKRFLLPDDRGVAWDAGAGKQALFSYRAFAHPVPAGSRAVEIRGTQELPAMIEGGALKAEPMRAYRIEPA